MLSKTLPANYSRELADYIIYVIDVSGGDKIPRKGGPGISQSDLLIVNKVRWTGSKSPPPRQALYPFGPTTLPTYAWPGAGTCRR